MAPSLLPYLDPGTSGLRLRLPMVPRQGNGNGIALATMEGTGPFSALLEVSLHAGQSEALQRLMLLIQPDTYPQSASELVGLTNPDIEGLWQAAAGKAVKAPPAQEMAPWPEQLDAQRRLLPWRPLFYCAFKQRFAHPLCPTCGDGLTLCRDDRCLSDAGLPAFNAGLQRYLYCPSCASTAEPPRFYARHLPEAPPAHLLGVAALMEQFSRLLTRVDLARDLPCIGCERSGECYGPATAVHERMAPLCFHPFYTLPRSAADLNLLEFSALLSNRSAEALAPRLKQDRKTGRLGKLQRFQERFSDNDGFLFSQPAQRFAEAFYLKLTLVETIHQLLAQTSEDWQGPVADLSLESFWVSLPALAARLPAFWHFGLQWVDTVGRPDITPGSGMLALCRSRAFLGTAFFHILLSNDQQDAPNVRQALQRLLTEAAASDPWQNEPLFDPGRAFAAAGSLALPPDCRALWQGALDLALSALRAGHNAERDWSDEQFAAALADLKQQAFRWMFQPAATAPAPAAIHPTEAPQDRQIANIVRAVLFRWPREPATPERHPESVAVAEHPLPNSEGDFMQTVILEDHDAAAAPLNTPEAPPAMQPPPSPPRTTGAGDGAANGSGDDLAATVMLPPEPPRQPATTAAQPEPPVPPERPTTGAAEDLEATILLSADASRPTSPSEAQPAPPAHAQSPPASAEQDLEATVLLSSEPSGQPPKDAPPATPSPPEGPPAHAQDDLEATVLIGHGGTPGRPAAVRPPPPASAKRNTEQPPHPEPEEDPLDETVIIQPQPSANRKSKP